MDTINLRMQISRALVLIYILSSVCCDVCRENCLIGRVQGFRTADCYRKDLTRVLQCLPRNTEILDLSFNRIREISKGDFELYSYLEILYLSDNILIEIDDNAFDDLTNLHTLDVSTNSLYNLPKALFSLPSLRKLYLANIKNTKMVEDIESAVPITSPLVYLDLSQNKLPRLPNLGEVPTLEIYNISGNTNVKLSTSMFSGLCNLQSVVNDKFSANFENPCECQMLEKWLTHRNVHFNSFNCKEIAECSTEISEKDLNVYNNCRRLHEVQQQQLFKKKLLTNVGISVAVIVGFLLVMLFYIYRRNKRLKEKKKMETEVHRNTKAKEIIDDQGLL